MTTTLRLRCYSAGILLALAPWTSATPSADVPPLSALVSLPPRPAGAPAMADIALSSRWPRPMGKQDQYDSFEALEAFHAVRLDWCYTGSNKAFVERAKAAGVPVFGAINAELSDAPGADTRLLGRDRNLQGEQIGNPELTQFVARGDVASEAFRGVVMAHCRAMLDAGVTGIHVDDPGMTYHGALHANAGYGEASLAAFRGYLRDHTSAAEREAWGLPADLEGFDYRLFALKQGKSLAPALREQFLAFHLESLNEFYGWLRTALDEYAGRHVPLSCNNGSNQIQEDWHVRNFDFWLGETGLAYGDPTARGIFLKTMGAEKLGRLQVFSPPNDGLDRLPDRAGYVALTRRIIATSYACGSLTLVPWDVWRRGPETPRFFGTREEFGDLYELVHKHPDLFDNHALAYATGPGMDAWSAEGLEYVPVTVPEGVFAAVRAVPGDAAAPIVVHLVDWRAAAGPVSLGVAVQLMPDSGESASVSILLPGADTIRVPGVNDGSFWQFELGELRPYGIVVVALHH